MKKVGDVVIRETKYIATWVIILSVVMEAVFLILRYWDYKVLLGNLLSGIFAVANFFFMGIAVEKAVAKEEKEAKGVMKTSQALRTFMLFAVAAFGVSLPCFNPAASIIPLFFPRIAITFRPFFDKKIKNT